MRWRALLVFVVVAAGLAGAQPVGATEYAVKQCHSGMVTGLDYWFPVAPSLIGAENKCPNQLEFRNLVTVEGDVTSQGDYAWFDSSVYTSHVQSMRLEFDGGDTTGATAYYITDCGDCAPEHEIVPDDDPGFDSVVFSSLAMDQIFIAARCVAATCPVRTPFKIRNIEFVADDSELPDIVVPRDPDSGDPLDWINERLLGLGVTVMDRLSGVSTSSVLIDGYPTWTRGECTQPIFNAWTGLYPCPRDDGSDQFPLVGDLTTGEHTIEVNATDAVGNSSSHYSTFKYDPDALPPIEGMSLLTSHGEENWTADPSIQVEFDDYELTAGSYNPAAFTGAPLDTYMTDLEPLSGQSEDPQQINAPSTGVVNWILPEEGRWRVWLWSLDEAGNKSVPRSIDVGLDLDAPPVPQLSANAWISADQLEDGYSQSWQMADSPAKNESGVCGFSFLVNGEPDDIPLPVITHGGAARSALIPDTFETGEFFAHIRSISCGGVPSETATIRLRVDGVPPTVGMFTDVAGDWTGQAGTATISANDDASGVSRIETSMDGQPWKEHFDSFVKLAVPDGEHTLRYRAVDVASNISDEHEFTFRVDANAPTARFAPRVLTEPTLLRVELADQGSGVASAWIEYRALGEAAWRRLGSAASGSELATGFVRSIDESSMLAGSYEFRVAASDLARNKVIGTADNGGLITLNLPLRQETRMSAGIAEVSRRCRRGEKQPKCRGAERIDLAAAGAFRRIRYGDSVAIVGALVDERNTPIAGRTIAIYAEPKSGVRQLARTVQTDANGEFVWKPGAVPTTDFDVRFEGDPVFSEQEVPLELKVRAAVTMKLSRKRIRANQMLRFTGHVGGATRFASGGTKTVEIQYLRGRKWTNTSYSPQTDSRGNFRAEISWRSIPRMTRLWFHAKVIPDGNWPFEFGSSERVSVMLIP